MQKKLKIAAVIMFFAATVIFTIYATRWVLTLQDPIKLADFQSKVASLGAGGAILLFVIQYIQIVIAFIPGGPIQIVAGALFGPWGGFAICIGGMLLATATVYYLVSRLGHSVISLFVEERDINEYKFLNNEKRLEILVFVLFFIPGTPKDALTYMFALTKMKMSRFMLLSTIARTPAIIISLMAGNSIVEGRLGRAFIMFIAMTTVGILGFFLQRLIKKHVKTKE